MPQNKVIEHFHQYEYDQSPTNYLFKPEYHLIYKYSHVNNPLSPKTTTCKKKKGGGGFRHP